MWRRGYAGGLALACLILTSCAPQVARIRLPEPALPGCLVEETTALEVVGVLEFAPGWVSELRRAARADPREGILAALGCAAEVAQAFRETLGIIRTNNRGSRP